MTNKSKPEFLEESNFNKIKSIQHAFFTRHGGVSEGVYSSLNCAYASNDVPENVDENRRRVMACFDDPSGILLTVKNVHSNRVITVEEPWFEKNKPHADGMVTKLKKVVLASDSADCPIILFADDKAEVIGLAHAGWRGAKSGVIESTIRAMERSGANTNNIVAAISPCITQDSYEVSTDFRHEFVQENPDSSAHFKTAQKPGHFMFDLPGYVIGRLYLHSLNAVHFLGIDTYRDQRFFSCRRSYHQGEGDFGGHFSCIKLR